MSVETNAEARPRVHPLMVELIIREIDGNAVIDAFTEKNLTVKITSAQAQAKADNIIKAFTKVSSKPPELDAQQKKAAKKNQIATYSFEQLHVAFFKNKLDAATGKSNPTSEELEVIMWFYRKLFSRLYDDGFYTGERSAGGEREGRGIFEFENGQRYDGEWLSDKFHGYGTYFLNDGATFSGDWRNGKQFNGTFEWPEL